MFKKKEIIVSLAVLAGSIVSLNALPDLVKADEKKPDEENTTSAVTSVPIDEAHFPDAFFRSYIQEKFDTTKDNTLTEEELDKIKTISMYNESVSSLRGIEYFYNLQNISVTSCNLLEVDASHNPLLKNLNIQNNHVSYLNISNCIHMGNLNVLNNELTSLDVTPYTELTYLSCGGNQQIDHLDVSKCTKLTSLSCGNTAITELDLHVNTKLTSLSFSNTNIRSVDVSNLTELTSLTCRKTQLTSLNLRNNPKLYDLNCGDSKLQSIKLRSHEKLKYLRCEFNQLSEPIDLSGCPLIIDLMNQVEPFYPSNETTVRYSLVENGMSKGEFCYDLNATLEFNKTFGDPMTSGYDRVLPDGDYIIATAASVDKNRLYFMDIYGLTCPAPDGSNVSIWSGEEPNSCDIWTIKYENGFYTIRQKGTSMYLEVAGTQSNGDFYYQGANVQVGNANSLTQKWAISRNTNDSGYRVESQISGLSLDLNGGKLDNLTNIQIWNDNDGTAQTWLFVPYTPAQPVSNGRYMLKSGLGSGWEMDVFGNSGDIDDKTNVQLYEDTALNQYNSFDLTKLDNGYYKIIHAASGKALTVESGSPRFCQNISVSTYKGELCQQWAIVKNGDGYILIARSSGLAADVQGGVASNGANVSQYPFSGNPNQLWTFVQAEHKVTYNANGGSGAPASQIKYYKNDLFLSKTKPTRSNCEFLGWGTSANTTTATYMAGGKYTADKNITLYAIWYPNAPSAPAGAKAVSGSATSITVSWNAVSRATGYEVYRSTSSNGTYVKLGEVTETSRKCPGLTTGKTYYFKVRAFVKVGGVKTFGSYSSVVSAKPQLPAPSSLKISEKATTSLTLSWKAVSGATGYEVYRATSSSGTYSKLGEVTETSRKCPGLTTGKKYFFKVRAYVTVNGTKKYSPYSSVVNGVTLLAAPTVKVSSSTSTSVTLSWNKVTGATGYEVYRSTSANGSFSRLGEVTTTSRKCPGLSSGKTYYFRVRAFVEIDGVKYYGNYSSVVSKLVK